VAARASSSARASAAAREPPGTSRRGAGQQRLLGLAEVVRVVEAEQQQPVRGQQRDARAEAGQLRSPLAQQVGDDHRVQHPGAGARRGGQVGVAVEGEQADIGAVPGEPGHHPEGDGAVAADHERHQVAP
jgi:hypothetical protein